MIQEYTGIDAEWYDSYIHLSEDVPFYVDLAREQGGPVLELGCGTGRIAIPTAEAGITIFGLDNSSSMLNIAKKKIAVREREIRNKITLQEGDMRNFHFDRSFSLITIPFRAFLHLLTVNDQRRALLCIHKHLANGGMLAMNIFDPDLQIIHDHSTYTGQALKCEQIIKNPTTGEEIVFWESRRYNLEEQTVDEISCFEEVDSNGRGGVRHFVKLKFRFIYRFEMQHLLEMCGFEIVNLFGDFNKGAFRSGGEQIWVCRKA